MAQTNVQAFSGDVEISGETVLGTATYRKRRDWNRDALAYVYLGNIRTSTTTGIRLDVSLNNSNTGYNMYQYQITLQGADASHAGGSLVYSGQGTQNNSVLRAVDIGYVYVDDGSGLYTYQLWLKDPTTDITGNMDAYLNCQGYYNFDTGVSDVAQGGAAPTNFQDGIVGLLVDETGNVGIGTDTPDNALHIRNAIPAVLLDDSDDDTKVRIAGGAGGDLYVDSNWGGSGNTGDIIFREASSEKMRIAGNGNVGIGTTNPLAAFEVQAADMDGAASGTSQVISRFSSGDDGVLNVFAVATGNGEETLGLQTQIDGRAFETDVSGGWVYGTDSRYDLSLQPYKGNVGIGTTNPAGNLHISSGTSGDCVLILEADTDNSNEDDNPRIEFRQDGGEAESAILQSDNYLDFRNSVSTRGGIRFFTGDTNGYTNAVERMHIDESGRIGIGTASPESMLHLSAETASADITDPITIKINNRRGAGDWSTTQPWGLLEFDTNDITAAGSGPVAGVGCRFESVGGGDSSLCFYTDGDNSNDNVLGPASERMCIDHTGRVGIGSTNPTTKLDVVGDILASGNVTAYSDRRLKSDIERIEGALDKVCALGGYTFTMNDKRSTGLIAQEVKGVLPEAVHGSEETQYSLAYGNILGLIVEAIKELKEKIG